MSKEGIYPEQDFSFIGQPTIPLEYRDNFTFDDEPSAVAVDLRLYDEAAKYFELSRVQKSKGGDPLIDIDDDAALFQYKTAVAVSLFGEHASGLGHDSAMAQEAWGYMSEDARAKARMAVEPTELMAWYIERTLLVREKMIKEQRMPDLTPGSYQFDALGNLTRIPRQGESRRRYGNDFLINNGESKINPLLEKNEKYGRKILDVLGLDNPYNHTDVDADGLSVDDSWLQIPTDDRVYMTGAGVQDEIMDTFGSKVLPENALAQLRARMVAEGYADIYVQPAPGSQKNPDHISTKYISLPNDKQKIISYENEQTRPIE